jgi:hypothetical protein
VIGKKCRNVPKEKALSVIAGYACFNDGSVRDWQQKSGGQFTLGKNFDGTGGFGPDIVTSDELPPGGAPLRIMTRVNGQVMQDSNTDDLIFDVPTLVHELSKVHDARAGRPDHHRHAVGRGAARKPQPWLKPGRRLRGRDREDRRAAQRDHAGRLVAPLRQVRDPAPIIRRVANSIAPSVSTGSRATIVTEDLEHHARQRGDEVDRDRSWAARRRSIAAPTSSSSWRAITCRSGFSNSMRIGVTLLRPECQDLRVVDHEI